MPVPTKFGTVEVFVKKNKCFIMGFGIATPPTSNENTGIVTSPKYSKLLGNGIATHLKF